jgi:hypothetical protein
MGELTFDAGDARLAPRDGIKCSFHFRLPSSQRRPFFFQTIAHFLDLL